MTETFLYVPVSLQALVHGRHNEGAADMTPAYDLLAYEPPFGNSVSNTWFSRGTREPGIHLHWAMPDGLLHGKQKEDGTMMFPALPNRFLLQRLWEQDGVVCRKAWLIYSDFVGSDPDDRIQTTVPVFVCRDGIWQGGGKNGQLYGYQGAVTEYGQPLDKEGFYLDRLTGIGDGNPAFAAYYPDSCSVFGFYDDMKDVEQGTFSYLLTGYYEKGDPLSGPQPEKPEDLEWQIREGGAVPARTMIHGYVKQVVWRGPDEYYEDRIPKDPVQIYMGDNTAEALSVLIQDQVPDIAGMERLMNYIQNDAVQVLANESDPDGLIKGEELLHSKKFTAWEGGCLWEIRDEREQDRLSQTEEDKEKENLLQEQLRRLNCLQEQLNRAEEQAGSHREQLYGAWWMYVTEQWEKEKKAPVPQEISREMDTLTRLLEQAEAWGKEASLLRETIKKRLESSGRCLYRQNENRYYRPNPPVVLLAGPGVLRSFRQGVTTQNGELLPCRKTLLQSLCVPLPDQKTEIGAKDLEAAMQPLATLLPDPVQALLTECLLLDDLFAAYVAKIALKKAGLSVSQKELRQLADQVAELQRQLRETDGAPKAASFENWQQPWNPLFLQWRASFAPYRTTLSPDNSFQEFVLGELDLETGKEGPQEQKPLEIKGRSLMLPHGVIHLSEMLQRLVELYGKEGETYEKLQKAAHAIQGMNVLSQQLTGFLEALAQKEDVPLFPLIPLENVPETEAVTAQANRLLQEKDTGIHSPVPGYEESSFVPVRAGTLRLEQLWLVDSFGQIQDIPVKQETVRQTETLRRQKDGGIVLPPRFVSPVRVQFRWQDKTPVFGCVMPNFLDRCLVVYNGQGTLLGSIQEKKKGALWISAPGTTICPREIPDGEGHLQAFIESFLGEDNDRLAKLLADLDKRAFAVEGGSRFLQLCFGSVLFLGWACLGLEEMGLSIRSSIWGGKPDTHGYETQPVTVRLGDVRKAGDGLAGFYIHEQDPAASYDRFYSCLEGTADLKISLRDEPAWLTLLFVPLGEISIRTGFLPAASAPAFPRRGEDRLEELDMMFRLMPIPGVLEELSVPLPGNLEDFWEFCYMENTERENTAADLKPPSESLPPDGMALLEGFMKTKRKKEKQ